jgi:hypothetical protein
MLEQVGMHKRRRVGNARPRNVTHIPGPGLRGSAKVVFAKGTRIPSSDCVPLDDASAGSDLIEVISMLLRSGALPGIVT